MEGGSDLHSVIRIQMALKPCFLQCFVTWLDFPTAEMCVFLLLFATFCKNLMKCIGFIMFFVTQDQKVAKSSRKHTHFSDGIAKYTGFTRFFSDPGQPQAAQGSPGLPWAALGCLGAALGLPWARQAAWGLLWGCPGLLSPGRPEGS